MKNLRTALLARSHSRSHVESCSVVELSQRALLKREQETSFQG